METELLVIHQKLDLLLQEVRALRKQNTLEKEEALFSIAEAATKLKLSSSRIYALIYEGKLRPLQREKYSRIQFDKQSINQYLYGNKQASNS